MTALGGRCCPNVLVTAAGRRTTLVQAFVDSAHAHGGRVVTSDVDALAPALLVGDLAVRSPRTDEAGYIDALLGIVQEHDVCLVVPTIDPDLPVLACSRDRFEALGCRALVSAPAFVDIVLDKVETGRVFADRGFAVPRTWLPPVADIEALPGRVFVKPRRGSASIDTYEISRALLGNVLPLVEDPLVQEVLVGPEITIDALLDLDGVPIHYVPRQRLRTVGGESVQGITLPKDPDLAAWIERVLRTCQELGAMGPLTLQAFLADQGPVLTEINARFGGGFPLGLEAGAAYPEWILDMVMGRPVPPRLGDYEPGVYMTRHNVERFVRQPAW